LGKKCGLQNYLPYEIVSMIYM